MTPLHIFIFDGHPRREIGEQIKRILAQRLTCVSELTSSLEALIHDAIIPNPDLFIPILPSFEQSVERIIAVLQDKYSNTPLLPVVDLNDLQDTGANLILQTNDFITIPLNDLEVFARVQRLITRKSEPQKKPMQRDSQFLGFEQLLGEAPSFVAVKKKIPQIALSEATVLITGETGTGKEIVARTLHYLSSRGGKPFLPVNCGAIPVDLFERELFGHLKGAYTGAWAAQPGLIEEAEGGTLFLDEVETLSLGAQVKLLRFLQDQTYHSLGSSKLRQANVWIIASTNVDLRAKVQEGLFREDFFYRLAVLMITLPPLRERRTDIPLLAAHFLKRYSEKAQPNRQLTPEAIQILCGYSWPGNVRELENVVRQIVALSESDRICPEDIPFPFSLSHSLAKSESFKQLKAKIIQEFEKSYITEMLELHDGNVTHAARAARKERRAFGRLIKKYNLNEKCH